MLVRGLLALAAGLTSVHALVASPPVARQAGIIKCSTDGVPLIDEAAILTALETYCKNTVPPSITGPTHIDHLLPVTGGNVVVNIELYNESFYAIDALDCLVTFSSIVAKCPDTQSGNTTLTNLEVVYSISINPPKAEQLAPVVELRGEPVAESEIGVPQVELTSTESDTTVGQTVPGFVCASSGTSIDPPLMLDSLEFFCENVNGMTVAPGGYVNYPYFEYGHFGTEYVPQITDHLVQREHIIIAETCKKYFTLLLKYCSWLEPTGGFYGGSYFPPEGPQIEHSIALYAPTVQGDSKVRRDDESTSVRPQPDSLTKSNPETKVQQTIIGMACVTSGISIATDSLLNGTHEFCHGYSGNIIGPHGRTNLQMFELGTSGGTDYVPQITNHMVQHNHLIKADSCTKYFKALINHCSSQNPRAAFYGGSYFPPEGLQIEHLIQVHSQAVPEDPPEPLHDADWPMPSATILASRDDVDYTCSNIAAPYVPIPIFQNGSSQFCNYLAYRTSVEPTGIYNFGERFDVGGVNGVSHITFVVNSQTLHLNPIQALACEDAFGELVGQCVPWAEGTAMTSDLSTGYQFIINDVVAPGAPKRSRELLPRDTGVHCDAKPRPVVPAGFLKSNIATFCKNAATASPSLPGGGWTYTDVVKYDSGTHHVTYAITSKSPFVIVVDESVCKAALTSVIDDCVKWAEGSYTDATVQVEYQYIINGLEPTGVPKRSVATASLDTIRTALQPRDTSLPDGSSYSCTTADESGVLARLAHEAQESVYSFCYSTRSQTIGTNGFSETYTTPSDAAVFFTVAGIWPAPVRAVNEQQCVSAMNSILIQCLIPGSGYTYGGQYSHWLSGWTFTLGIDIAPINWKLQERYAYNETEVPLVPTKSPLSEISTHELFQDGGNTYECATAGSPPVLSASSANAADFITAFCDSAIGVEVSPHGGFTQTYTTATDANVVFTILTASPYTLEGQECMYAMQSLFDSCQLPDSDQTFGGGYVDWTNGHYFYAVLNNAPVGLTLGTTGAPPPPAPITKRSNGYSGSTRGVTPGSLEADFLNCTTWTSGAPVEAVKQSMSEFCSAEYLSEAVQPMPHTEHEFIADGYAVRCQIWTRRNTPQSISPSQCLRRMNNIIDSCVSSDTGMMQYGKYYDSVLGVIFIIEAGAADSDSKSERAANPRDAFGTSAPALVPRSSDVMNEIRRPITVDADDAVALRPRQQIAKNLFCYHTGPSVAWERFLDIIGDFCYNGEYLAKPIVPLYPASHTYTSDSGFQVTLAIYAMGSQVESVDPVDCDAWMSHIMKSCEVNWSKKQGGVWHDYDVNVAYLIALFDPSKSKRDLEATSANITATTVATHQDVPKHLHCYPLSIGAGWQSVSPIIHDFCYGEYLTTPVSPQVGIFHTFFIQESGGMPALLEIMTRGDIAVRVSPEQCSDQLWYILDKCQRGSEVKQGGRYADVGLGVDFIVLINHTRAKRRDFNAATIDDAALAVAAPSALAPRQDVPQNLICYPPSTGAPWEAIALLMGQFCSGGYLAVPVEHTIPVGHNFPLSDSGVSDSGMLIGFLISTTSASPVSVSPWMCQQQMGYILDHCQPGSPTIQGGLYADVGMEVIYSLFVNVPQKSRRDGLSASSFDSAATAITPRDDSDALAARQTKGSLTCYPPTNGLPLSDIQPMLQDFCANFFPITIQPLQPIQHTYFSGGLPVHLEVDVGNSSPVSVSPEECSDYLSEILQDCQEGSDIKQGGIYTDLAKRVNYTLYVGVPQAKIGRRAPRGLGGAAAVPTVDAAPAEETARPL